MINVYAFTTMEAREAKDLSEAVFLGSAKSVEDLNSLMIKEYKDAKQEGYSMLAYLETTRVVWLNYQNSYLCLEELNNIRQED